VAFDPFLYVAFIAGFVAGRLTRWRSPWVERATIGSVVVLLGLLGSSLHSVAPALLLNAVPVSLLFLGLIMGATLAVVSLLPHGVATGDRGDRAGGSRGRIVLVFAAALVLGYAGLGPLGLPASSWIEYVLYLLLALVAFDLQLHRADFARFWVPLGAALVGSTVAAGVMVALSVLPASAAFATAFGFGWYTLSGPLVAARLGPALGLVAFLTNFLRESTTMLSAPWLGSRLGGAGIAAAGGATSMDTTLYFANRFGERGAGGLALSTGLALTVLASAALPVILGLGGA